MNEKGMTCPITNATGIATISLRPIVPDRQAFQREQLKIEDDGMKIEINEIKRLLAEKNALLPDIENDLVYRDESKLTTRLEELEITYSQTKFTSSRTENKEIDKLERNRAKLAQVF
ncbi:hypothetical protein QQG55_56075 [Brugia pahangi]|uniref:Cwf21 domain-containing protein n=1 Tax=Brugia pahangi TaxID=6280 RepID=A0A0N4T416_BRUPA|nr:unnamed protein product [Brugia pahangi]